MFLIPPSPRVAPLFALALASRDPGGGRPGCRAQGMKLQRGLPVRERKAVSVGMAVESTISFFLAPPIHT